MGFPYCLIGLIIIHLLCLLDFRFLRELILAIEMDGVWLSKMFYGVGIRMATRMTRMGRIDTDFFSLVGLAIWA
jgi:hypothetical protein